MECNNTVEAITTKTNNGSYTIYRYGVTPWKFCPECSQELGAEWKFCAGCGARTNAIQAPEVATVTDITASSITVPNNNVWYYPGNYTAVGMGGRQ